MVGHGHAWPRGREEVTCADKKGLVPQRQVTGKQFIPLVQLGPKTYLFFSPSDSMGMRTEGLGWTELSIQSYCSPCSDS